MESQQEDAMIGRSGVLSSFPPSSIICCVVKSREILNLFSVCKSGARSRPIKCIDMTCGTLKQYQWYCRVSARAEDVSISARAEDVSISRTLSLPRGIPGPAHLERGWEEAATPYPPRERGRSFKAEQRERGSTQRLRAVTGRSSACLRAP